MIRLRAVSKTYRDEGQPKPVFDNIDLDLPCRHIIGIIGDKGSGKSTLLKLLCGQEQPDRGHIETNRRVAIPLGQNPGLSPQLTGRENTAFIARALGIPVAKMIHDVEQLADLGRKFDQPFRVYTKPLRRRLSYAVSFAARFDFYLMDEQLNPTGSDYQKLFVEHFEHLRRRAGIIIASSKPRLLRQHCDSIVVLENGSASFYEDVKLGLQAYRKISPRFANSPEEDRSDDGQNGRKSEPDDAGVAKIEPQMRQEANR